MKQKPNANSEGIRAGQRPSSVFPILRCPKPPSTESWFGGFEARIPACNQSVCRLVLLRAAMAFNKTVVLRYRINLRGGLAPGTINVRMAAVRRLAYEAADCGLLSPELAAGIHRLREFADLDLAGATGFRRVKRLPFGAPRQRDARLEAQSSYIGNFAGLWSEAPGTR